MIWQYVKRLFHDEQFLKELFIEAQGLKKNSRDQKPQEKLKSKMTGVDYQIEALSERIGALPKELDPKPLFDQLAKLQKAKKDFEAELRNHAAQSDKDEAPINMEDFLAFTEGLKDLVAKESRPEAIAAIIRKLVHRIEITDEGAIVHYPVGENHFIREFNEVLNSKPQIADPKNKKGLVDLTRPFSHSLLKYRDR